MSSQDVGATREPNIMIPLDGSRFGEAALPVALGLAQDLRGQLKLVSVSGNGHVSTRRRISSISPEHAEPLDSELSQYLETLGTRIERVSTVPVSRVVLGGSATKALAEFNDLSHPDLIVMSTHGCGPLCRAWIGSVADWLIRHVATPIMLVHPNETGEVDPAKAHQIRHVVVPLDGSELAEESLEWVKRTVQATNASCTLIQVAHQSFSAWSPYLRRRAPEVADYTQVGSSASQDYLSSVAGRLQEEGVNADTAVDGGVPAAVGVLRCAEERSADLIVIASHGRGGLRRLVLGSVADKIVRASEVPVLVVRPG
ncbi:MAG: hypothetical protein AMS18_07500 [Gemmatimonas sp. SG8_17]|nr:MAG: hypothetical protein AMS18_07500 [Gemmatimonas sp. SG8_17]